MARSDNWRINKSGQMGVEGAQVLKALQKVAGAAGLPKAFKVRFATKARLSGIDFDKKEVVIGAGQLFTEAPVPADLFDVLVGLTLHEVGHQQIETQKVWDTIVRHFSGYHKTLSQFVPGVDKAELDLLGHFVNVGEDIVIEARTRSNPNLEEYDGALHKWAVAQLPDGIPDNLFELWIEYALGHKATNLLDLPEEFVEPMSLLSSLTGWLRSNHHASYATRSDVYEMYWAQLKDVLLKPFPKPPPPQESEPEPSPDTGQKPEQKQQEAPEKQQQDNEPAKDAEPTKDDKSSEDGEPEPSKALNQTGGDGDSVEPSTTDTDAEPEPVPEPVPKHNPKMDRPLERSDADALDENLVAEMELAVEEETEDVTEDVREEFETHSGAQVAMPTVIRSRESKSPLIQPNPFLRKRLERIMSIRKGLQVRTMHGEQYGKIDKRHLHRIRTDERVFSLRYKFPDGFPKTRILLDMSGSMHGREAEEVLEAAGTLQTLVGAEVWCYSGSHTVNLVRVDDGKQIRQANMSGLTPSGIALVAVALGMKRNGLIIHLTDGDHNSGQSPWIANWILKKKGIELVNIIWGGKLGRHYGIEGMNNALIDGLPDFPDALYKILVEKSKLQKIGGR